MRARAAEPQRTPEAAIERVDGIVIPGMPNAHSHAFQRAMAGNAEYRSSARDSFWTWRQAMYALANRIGPEELRIVATQLFVEMLKAVIPRSRNFTTCTARAAARTSRRESGCGRRSAKRPPWQASA